MKSKIAIGILAFNEEKHIDMVVNDLLIFDIPVFVINDNSTDSTFEILKKYEDHKNIYVIDNEKNIGAGASTKKLLKHTSSLEFDFIIKVDGDGQFSVKDVKRIIELYEKNNYDFIKSNRFWSKGIKGNIPKIRFFGNLLATLFLQISSGTNKLYDPLNGLFGTSLEIVNFLDDKNYPKRYGYPYFLTLTAVINNFKTYQINNTVEYNNQNSNLNSVKVFFTILKLSFLFYFRKLNNKKLLGNYQRSAFFDILFLFSLSIVFILFFLIFYISFYAATSIISTSNLLILLVVFLIISLSCFVASFKEEKNIRNEYIEIET